MKYQNFSISPSEVIKFTKGLFCKKSLFYITFKKFRSWFPVFILLLSILVLAFFSCTTLIEENLYSYTREEFGQVHKLLKTDCYCHVIFTSNKPYWHLHNLGQYLNIDLDIFMCNTIILF